MQFWDEDVLYKHANNTDVAFHVVRQSLMDEDVWELTVYWWNIGQCHKPWCMDVRQTIKVKESDRANWHSIPTN